MPEVMTQKKIKLVLLSVLIVLISCTVLVLIVNLPFFNINEIEVSYSGIPQTILPETERIISCYYGENLNKVSVSAIKKNILTQPFVKEVSVKKFFPGKLIIGVEYKDYGIRMVSEDLNGNRYFLAGTDDFCEVGYVTFSHFSSLPTVKVRGDYLNFLESYPVGNSLEQVVEMISGVEHQSLISTIKYDNNKQDTFGRVLIEFKNTGSVLVVKDPVTGRRLNEALDIIAREIDILGYDVEYNLYSAELVRRT